MCGPQLEGRRTLGFRIMIDLEMSGSRVVNGAWCISGPVLTIERSVESLAAHASRRSRRSLLSMRLLCFNEVETFIAEEATNGSRECAPDDRAPWPSRRMGCNADL